MIREQAVKQGNILFSGCGREPGCYVAKGRPANNSWRHLLPLALALVALAALLLLPTSALADKGTVPPELERAIQEKGLDWKPRAYDRDFALGLLELPEQQLPPKKEAKSKASLNQLATIDWRNNGGNFISPIKDQGDCGSCWAFASVAGLESGIAISGQTPGSFLDLSEQILVSCESQSAGCDGGYIYYAAQFLRNTGTAGESCFRYTATNNSCSNACANWQASARRISSFSGVSQSANALRAALANGPVVTGYYVYSDFLNYGSGVYQYAWGSREGGHAVLIVGYVDTPDQYGGGYFIVKNSWGSAWGESGYFRIGYSQVTSVVQFGVESYQYQVSASPSPSPTPSTSSSCDPGRDLGCGGSDDWNNGGAGSTNRVDSYPCSVWEETGPEYTYRFIPNASGEVTVSLSNLSDDLDIFVLDVGPGGECNAANCLAAGTQSGASDAVTFNAVAGHTYYLVVDGYQGAVSNYHIAVTCPCATPGTPALTAPANGSSTGDDTPTFSWSAASNASEYQIQVDNNSDFSSPVISATTASTSHTPLTGLGNATYWWQVRGHNAGGGCDVWGPWSDAWSVAIVSGICNPARDLACGGSDDWNNGGAGSTDQIDSYPPSPWDESGPEYTYRFVPNVSGWVSVSLSNLTANLHIFVLDGGSGECAAANCIAYGPDTVAFNAVAGHTYYLVVDGYWGAVSNYHIAVSCPSCATPGTPALTAPANGSTSSNNPPTFTWSAASDASEYQIQVDDNADFSTPLADARTTSTSYTSPSAWGSGTYRWRVRGHNTSGGCDVYGPWSAVWSVTIGLGAPFAPPTRWIASFGYAQGWTSQNLYPRYMGDVSGDGRADVVGFFSDGVYVSRSTGTSFLAQSRWIAKFGTAQGWSSQNTYPRMVADVNKDGRADVVGFFSDGVYVSLSTGTGFGAPSRWIARFGTAQGWSSQDKYPRCVADVSGDGRADVVGFFNDGVYVSLSTGTSFAAPTRWIAGYGYSAGGWTSQGKYPRCVADVNGDGLADVVGFGNNGAYASLSTGTGFGPSQLWIAGYGYSAGGWTSQDKYPRCVADVNGDGRADVVGFGNAGAFFSLSTGTSFDPPQLGIAAYGYSTSAGGWTSQNLYPRWVADVAGGGKADIVGFAKAGAYVSVNLN